MPMSICFALFVANNAQKHFFAQMCGLFSSVFKALFLIKLPLLFKNWVGVVFTISQFNDAKDARGGA